MRVKKVQTLIVTVGPTLIHFVVHCPAVEEYGIAGFLPLFGDKYLVCKHTDTPHHHWHLQGELASPYDDKAVLKD